MTPRPLIKWKSFWLGMLLSGVLGLAWARPIGRDEGITARGPNTQRAEAVIRGGVLAVSSYEGEMDEDFLTIRSHSSDLPEGEVDIGRNWALLSKQEDSTTFWWVAFPMWLPFVSFVMAWSAWLVIHWKHEQKKPPA